MKSDLKRKDASLVFLILIVLLVAGSGTAAVLMMNYDSIEEAILLDKVINTLFIIEGRSGKPLCSFVLMYYPATERAAIFDIPGETGLILKLKDVNRVDRIDTVYQPQKITAYQNEVASLLGIEIKFSVVFDIDRLAKTIDLLEGVELFIPISVEMFDSDPPVLFSSGVSTLDGDKAVSYITYELEDEDAYSVKLRRQRFFYAFIKRLEEQNEMLKQKTVAKFYQSFLRVSMKEKERVRLFDEYAKINIDRVNIQTVTGITREVSGQILLLPAYNGSLIKDIVHQTLGTLTQQTENSNRRVWTAEVLNGTSTNGLAGRTAELLKNFGYDVISVGNAPSEYDKTVIINRTGMEETARNFGEVIRCDNFREESLEMVEEDAQNLNYRADFILIIGRDFNGRYVTGG
ncbi:MAG: LCP family protein [Treponema sp.]|jgi:anionic cell wall polymer biosynthesis LytR-Cps2A-Psr (LCP) family protein|nr:LCP family protein [Treponema sp.]